MTTLTIIDTYRPWHRRLLDSVLDHLPNIAAIAKPHAERAKLPVPTNIRFRTAGIALTGWLLLAMAVGGALYAPTTARAAVLEQRISNATPRPDAETAAQSRRRPLQSSIHQHEGLES